VGSVKKHAFPDSKNKPHPYNPWLSCREGQSICNSANENERNRFENQINEHCSASAHSHQGKIEDTIGLFKGKSSTVFHQ
jgi:hypothetical protein